MFMNALLTNIHRIHVGLKGDSVEIATKNTVKKYHV